MIIIIIIIFHLPIHPPLEQSALVVRHTALLLPLIQHCDTIIIKKKKKEAFENKKKMKKNRDSTVGGRMANN